MTRIPLPAMFDLPAAMLVADALRADAEPVVLDGSAVDRVGIAGLQLLLSASATAVATGRSISIDTPSPAMRAVARTAGADLLFASDR